MALATSTAGRCSADLYASAASGWAAGADAVYLPLARALVATSPQSLAGARVLDVGAGTGAGSQALIEVGARPLALDVALGMLRHRALERPPAMVGDAYQLPVADAAVDVVLAPFVLNHLDDPVVALAELARVVGPGGLVLASSFSSTDRLAVKDIVDGVVRDQGWVAPLAYRWLKEHALDLLGTAGRMSRVAEAAGLVDIRVAEVAVPVGVLSPSEQVGFRLGMAHVAEFLAGLDGAGRADVVAAAEAAVAAADDGAVLAPVVVMLAARVAD